MAFGILMFLAWRLTLDLVIFKGHFKPFSFFTFLMSVLLTWPRTFLSLLEYTITMYDTKNRELRWNATYSDYASTLPDDDIKYSEIPTQACSFVSSLSSTLHALIAFNPSPSAEMAHFVSNGDGLVVTVDSETGDVQWVQNYNSPVVAMYIWQREGLRKVPHTNVAVETLRYLTFMSGEVGRITQWKYPFPKEKKPQNKFL